MRVPCKGDVKHCRPIFFKLTSFHNDAKNSRGMKGKKMNRKTIPQRAVNNKCKCLFFAIKYDSFGFYLAPKVGTQSHSNKPKLNYITNLIPTTFAK